MIKSLCQKKAALPSNGIHSPVNYVVSLQIIQGKRQLTNVQLNSSFIKVDILLQMVTQITSK